MSGFLSSKYLKYLQASSRERIEEDLFCVDCGHNVRGLNYGRACPECGVAIEAPGDAGSVSGDVLLAGGPARRRAWRLGLGLAFVSLTGAVAARLLLFSSGFWGIDARTAWAYLWFGMVMSVLWVVAAWLVTPPVLGHRWILMGSLRWVVRGSQLLWPAAYACWMYGLAAQIDAAVMWGRVLRAMGGLGAILLALMLMPVAMAAHREVAARRLNAAVWLLPILTLLPQPFVGNIPWFWLVPLAVVLLLWAWVMMLYALGVGEMQRHVSWTMSEADRLMTRDERIARMRQEIDRDLAASVRPPPVSQPDIAMDPPEESSRRADESSRTP